MADNRPEVSILIPAYQAAEFIDRTLYLARGQTFPNLRILVSVDAGTDETADRVRAHADRDARVELHVQRRQQGWVGNVNFLLQQVRTPFFFIYFHDDVILPQYVETLWGALDANPEAASVHCDMDHFGAEREISLGRPMPGPTVRRLLDFMLSPRRSSPLRSLVRRDLGGHLRLPQTGPHGLWANEAFLLDLLAAGPAVHVPQTLYYRWNLRSGGLTDGWKNLPPEVIVEGWQSVIEHSIRIFDRSTSDPQEREALVFGLFLKVFPFLHQANARRSGCLFDGPGGLHPRFGTLDLPVDLGRWGDDIVQWADQRWQLCQKGLR